LARKGAEEEGTVVVEYPSMERCVVGDSEIEEREGEVEVAESVCKNGKIVLAMKSAAVYVVPGYFNTIPVSFDEDTNKIYLGGVEGGKVLRNGEVAAVEKKGLRILRRRCLCELGGEEEGEDGVKNEKILLENLEKILTRSFLDLAEKEKTVAISFSGGIDSLVCAVLAAKNLKNKPIYLINTSFSKNGNFSSKDRENSLERWNLIKNLAKNEVKYVENNITREEVLENQKEIASLAKNTTMDFNLASLHYFSAKKASTLGASQLLTGTGGDELFLGYARHKNNRAPKDAILQEVENFDVQNLHRDYRAAHAHRVLLASPFLSHRVLLFSLKTCTADTVGKKPLVLLLQKTFPNAVGAFPKKLAGQFGSGISDTIRSIKCRAPTPCKNNECLSLECSK